MRLRFRPNPRKAVEVILYLAGRRPGLGKHAVLKLLFYADKYHLNRYGRPIVGDDYRALQWGPVGMVTFDVLNGTDEAREALGAGDLPFEVRDVWHVYPSRAADLDLLSSSDREALDWAFERYGALDFNALTQASHDEAAWINADGGWMDYADFLDPSDDREERLADLADAAPRVVI